jgi:hypothetical protein
MEQDERYCALGLKMAVPDQKQGTLWSMVAPAATRRLQCLPVVRVGGEEHMSGPVA